MLFFQAEVDEDDDGDGDVDDGYNPGEMKMKAAKLAAAVNDSNDKDTEGCYERVQLSHKQHQHRP